MSTTHIIAGIAIIVAVIITISCKNKSVANTTETTHSDTSKAAEHHTNKNTYADMRKMAMSVSPEQLGLSLSNKTTVYGVVIDWGIDNNIATIVSFQTGDASLYLSSGGSIIGGGQHLVVNNAAKQLVGKAQSFLEHATKTENTTILPVTDEVRFYLLTNNGIYTGKDDIKNFENESSVWMQLFSEANKMITEIRKIADK